VNKVRAGISFDHDVIEVLDEQVTTSPDLSADRSEIVNAVMKFFFSKEGHDDNHDITRRIRELLIHERRTHSDERQGRDGTG
jgi:hypothetical protein